MEKKLEISNVHYYFESRTTNYLGFILFFLVAIEQDYLLFHLLGNIIKLQTNMLGTLSG